jgi:cytochrome c peroxidase
LRRRAKGSARSTTPAAADYQLVGVRHPVGAWAVLIAVSLYLVIGGLDPRPFPSNPTEDDLAQLRALYAGPPSTWPRPTLLPGAKFTEMAALELRPRPEGKEQELARLGGELFNDPRLSASGHFACQSCHNRRLGWGDGLPVSFGHGRATGKRNAPSLFTAGYQSSFFWDGRAQSLEEQALGPLSDGREMANAELAGVAERVNAVDSYRDKLAALTGRSAAELEDITKALAAFQRTLGRATRFDRFVAGDPAELNGTEIWGLHLFRTKAGCANCHSGPLLSDGGAHNLGLSFFGRGREDLGRYALTNKPEDAGVFRTPSLRHLSQTSPYMHNGIFGALPGVVRFYEAGGGQVGADRKEEGERQVLLESVRKKSPLLEPFSLTPAERAALVVFLQSL